MKQLLLLFPFLLLGSLLPAQQIHFSGGCGAQPGPETIARMDSLQPLVDDYTARFLETPQRFPVASVPIKVHVIRRSNGTDGYTQAAFQNALATANLYFQNANLNFVQCGAINFINSDAFYNLDFSEESALASAHNETNVINLYIPGGTLTSNGRNLCGYAYFPWSSKDIIIVKKSCMDSGNTFAHELGHYMGLYHTHGKFDCGNLTDELVNGSNCSTAGDNVCDTPADPNLSGPECDEGLVSNCVYIGSYLDANGQFFSPEVRNIMSYAPHGCRDLFSDGQYARASFYYNNSRNYLSCNSCNPPPASSMEVEAAGYSWFNINWEAVSGAEEYQSRQREVGTSTWSVGSWYNSTGVIWVNRDPCSTYEFQVRSRCNGLESEYSSSFYIDTEGCGDDYCYAYGRSWDFWIQAVGLSDMFNSSGNNYGYFNYTTRSANVNRGAAYNISLDPGTSASSETVYWGVWIDFNRDADFTDAGEQVVASQGTNLNTLSENINIPSSASLGATRMRVIMDRNGAPTPCAVDGYREVEDYTININGIACEAPTGLTVAEAGYAYSLVEWGAVSGATAYQTRIRKQGNSNWIDGNWYTVTSIVWGNLEPCATYEIQVRADCDSEYSDYSGTRLINTEGCGEAYCYSYGLAWDDWISAVNFAGINNTTGQNYGYENYTSLSGSAEAGQSYPLSLSADTDDGPEPAYWRAWIDFNGDNDFEDSGELVFQAEGTNQSTVSGNISIPASVPAGSTRMRVSMSISGFSDPCQVNGFREVEDYTINISQPAATLEVNPEFIDVSVAAGSATVQVFSNTGWTANEASNWVGLTDASGNGNGSFQVNFTENPGTSLRTTLINVQAGNISRTVELRQEGQQLLLTVDPQSLNIGANAGIASFSISSNTGWSISDNASWLSASPINGSNNGNIQLTHSANTSATSRTAVVTITANGLPPKTLNIVQAGIDPYLEVTTTVIDVGAAGGSTSFGISSNTNWSITESAGWLIVSPFNGSNNGAVAIDYEANPSTNSRQATILVSGEGALSQLVTIRQAGMAGGIAVSPSSQSADASSGCLTFSLTANTAWSAAYSSNWILSVSPDSGNGNASVEVCYAANTGGSLRSGTVTFSGGGTSAQATIQQAGAASSIAVSPSSQSVSAESGCSTFALTANTSWSATYSADWILSLSPDSGSGNASVEVCYADNTGSSSRSGTVTFNGGGTSAQATIQQAAAATTTPPWPVTPTGANHIIIVPANLDQDIGGQPLGPGDWIGFFFDDNGTAVCAGAGQWSAAANQSFAVFGDDSQTSTKDGFANGETFQVRVWRAATAEELEVTATFTPPTGIISSTDAYETDGISQLAALESRETEQPWPVSPTGSNHIIVVPSNLQSDINGQPLTEEDWIGFFFDDNGTAVCAGAGQWSAAANQSFPVFGDDAQTTAKDGFANGEAFQVKVWKAASGQEYEVEARFSPPNFIISQQGEYADDGISQLASLGDSQASVLTLSLQKGWNMVSSYILPESPDMMSIFAPVIEDVIIIKNGAGSSVIPQLGINNIGDWDITQGYKIKMNREAELAINGTKADPSTTPIPIESGWQIIAYLRDSPSAVPNEMASINNELILLKDNSGASYIPQLGINNIGNLKPTQGYQLKATGNTLLTYSPNGGGAPAALQPGRQSGPYYPTHRWNTGNNATLVLPAEATEGWLSPGDEIGVFSQSGQLCGSAIYRGEHLALPIWGDDLSTSSATEGLQDGEPFTIRYWSAAGSEERQAHLQIKQGPMAYSADGFFIAESLELINKQQELADGHSLKVECYPNPADGFLNLRVFTNSTGPLEVAIFSSSGQRAYHRRQEVKQLGWHQLSLVLEQLPAGFYKLQVRLGEETRQQSFIKQ